MQRLLSTLILLAIGTTVRAEIPPEVLALQKSVQKAIDSAEPSIACLLISRSTKYADLGEPVTPGVPGKLGGFSPQLRGRFMDGAQREMIKRLDLANPETIPESYGSGIVIDSTGLILTMAHVVDRATKVFVRLKGNVGSYADIVASDPRSDLAVLRMISPQFDLKPIKFGDGDAVRKGDLIITIANPFAAGFKDGSPSSGWGMVSNVRRRIPGPPEEVRRARPLAQHATLIQTDARLNLGCSGGALLNLNGELVGITTSLAATTGGEQSAGYAVPLDSTIRRIIEVLRRGELVEYGFLGVQVEQEERAPGRGVIVRDVPPGLPAQRAGIRGGDLVVSINGKPVREHDDLFLHIGASLAGSTCKIDVLRGGQPLSFEAKLAKWATNDEAAIASNRPKPVFGVRVDYTSVMSLDTSPPDGVYLLDLETGSAGESKLKKWSDSSKLIITAVNGRPVTTPTEFYREASGKPSITLDIVEAIRTSDNPRKRVILP